MPNLSDFDYELPKRFIAQGPAVPRDHSKLMILKGDEIQHRYFYEIHEYFQEGDVLVLNDTKVLPARLKAIKATGGKAELLVMNLFSGKGNRGPSSDDLIFECLIKGKVKEGLELELKNLSIKAKIREHIEEGRYYVKFIPVRAIGKFETEFIDILNEFGDIPLPPYIKNTEVDTSSYQTVFSNRTGSIAAPTAGLHFSDEVIKKLHKIGVKICFITLHISYGTFKPVREMSVENHSMDFEYYQVNAESAEILNEARYDKRLTAVGTTSVRTLETIYQHNDSISETEGETDLFIYPGYKFRSGINRLITNFHFPKSTLLMLVGAFAGTKRILRAYEVAKKNNYRFFSFGDAMLIM